MHASGDDSSLRRRRPANSDGPDNCGAGGGLDSAQRNHPASHTPPSALSLPDNAHPPLRPVPKRWTAVAASLALTSVLIIGADFMPRVRAHGDEDHGGIDLRELHAWLLLLAWGIMIPVHVVLLLWYQWTDKSILEHIHIHPMYKRLYTLHLIGIICYGIGFVVILIAAEQDGGRNHELDAPAWQRTAHHEGGFIVGAVGLIQELLPQMFETIPFTRKLHVWNGRLLFAYVWGIQLWTGFVLMAWPTWSIVLWLAFQFVVAGVCVGFGVAARWCPRTPAVPFSELLRLRLQKLGLEVINPYEVRRIERSLSRMDPAMRVDGGDDGGVAMGQLKGSGGATASGDGEAAAEVTASPLADRSRV